MHAIISPLHAEGIEITSNRHQTVKQRSHNNTNRPEVRDSEAIAIEITGMAAFIVAVFISVPGT
jgi:hypothetical protein